MGGGVILTVSSTNASTKQVTLANSTGFSVTLLAGTRLVDLTNPPTAYADHLGLAAIGNTAYADSGGRATVYLAAGIYDHLVTNATPPVVDAVVTESLTGSQATLSWNHTASGTSRLVLVAVSWQEESATETLDSVTYGDLPMSLMASTSLVDVFALIDPPTGSQEIVVTWSGSGAKGAAVASISLVDADLGTGFGPVRTAGGTGTSASVSLPNTFVEGFVLAVLGVNTVAGSTTATADAQSTARWNLTGGSVPSLTRTLGAGLSRVSPGGTVAPSWTLSTSKPWGVVGVEILPAGARLHVDETGVACSGGPFGLNALDFGDLQQAIDALPPQGGVVYVPAGTYRLREGLQIRKENVTLIGEGATSVVTPDDPENHPLDLLTISAAETRLHRLKFDGTASSRDLADGTCGIVFNGYTGPGTARLVQHCFLENVIATGCSRYGVLMLDTILATAINCEFVTNLGGGLRLQGTQPHGNCDALRFIACAMSNNGGIGVDIGDPVVPPDEIGTGMAGITFLGCTIELNQGNSIGDDLSLVGVAINANVAYKLEILSCYFEAPPEGCEQYLRFANCPNVTVNDCLLSGEPADYESGPDRAMAFYNCKYARVSSNVMQGFKTEVIFFAEDCDDCVEMCNRDFDAGTDPADIPRINIAASRVIGMSQHGLLLPRVADDNAKPSGSFLRTGLMIWVDTPGGGDTHLQIFDGTDWVSF